MFVIAITLICFIGTVIAIHATIGIDAEGIALSFLVGILGLCMSILIMFVTGVVALNVADVSVANETRVELVALDENNCYLYQEYDGDEQEFKYSYIYNIEGKGLRLCSDDIEANQVYFNYIDENEQPYFIKIEKQFSNPIVEFVATNSWLLDEYYIYIPKNSIAIQNVIKY